jgi:hypothetical protein
MGQVWEEVLFQYNNFYFYFYFYFYFKKNQFGQMELISREAVRCGFISVTFLVIINVIPMTEVPYRMAVIHGSDMEDCHLYKNLFSSPSYFHSSFKTILKQNNNNINHTPYYYYY